jgi:hypothetical protein
LLHPKVGKGVNEVLFDLLSALVAIVAVPALISGVLVGFPDA